MGGGMAAEDLFAQFFGGGGFGGGLGGMFGGGMRETGPKKARTIHHVHKVSLEDIYRGKVSKLALQKSVICASCDGRGGKEGAVRTCPGCNGAGMKTMMRQMGPMIQRFQTVCPDCQGEVRPSETRTGARNVWERRQSLSERCFMFMLIAVSRAGTRSTSEERVIKYQEFSLETSNSRSNRNRTLVSREKMMISSTGPRSTYSRLLAAATSI